MFIPEMELMGFEPTTPCLQGRCSSNWATTPKWTNRDSNPSYMLARHTFSLWTISPYTIFLFEQESWDSNPDRWFWRPLCWPLHQTPIMSIVGIEPTFSRNPVLSRARIPVPPYGLNTSDRIRTGTTFLSPGLKPGVSSKFHHTGIMRLQGLEPWTWWLRATCSTS